MVYIKNKYIIAIIIALIVLIIGVCFLKNSENFGAEKRKEIFEDYYEMANEKILRMTLEEKIGQMLLVHYPEENAEVEVSKYKFGGYLLFEKDFKDLTKEEVKEKIRKAQEVSRIPLLIAVDEEGGKVVRVSSNPNLASERFKSPRELYEIGGFERIKEDVIEKSKVLYDLGINLNFAPVVDVSTSEEDYIYPRTLGEKAELTSEYAKSVISAGKGTNVSYTLKHFPGYGSNKDTHIGGSNSNKSYEEILENDLPPFSLGIEAGAEAVMMSHNTVTNIDSENPASLSKKMIDLLRNELGFSGVIITDDLNMGAVKTDKDAAIKAILAGNDILITAEYENNIENIKRAVNEGIISESIIDKAVRRILAWKMIKKMM